MGRPTVWAAALALALVSCTDASSEPDAPATTVAPAIGPGRLVVLDSSGDVVVVDSDGANRSPITDDGGEDTLYTQPVWSPDASRLAWGQLSDNSAAVAIHEPESDVLRLVETSNLPFFVSWSPDGESLGVLHNGASGIDFRIVDVDEGTSITVDTAAPYYFSWSPEGDRVVTHAGVDRVETIAPDGGRDRLEPTSPTYLAPQWTSRGVFHVVGDQLVIEDQDGVRGPVATVSGLTLFVANHQGTRVALQASGDGDIISVALTEVPTVPSGSLVVVDVETGAVDVVDEALALGFFWSPDGESLLVMSPGDEAVVPRVWSSSGGTTDYVEYLPSGTMLRDTLPFFPQYAQSVRFWSPDSTAFAFAGAVDGEQGIWVQGLADSRPTRVSDGTWVAWSSGGP